MILEPAPADQNPPSLYGHRVELEASDQPHLVPFETGPELVVEQAADGEEQEEDAESQEHPELSSHDVTALQQLAKSQIIACVFSVPIGVVCALVLGLGWNDHCSAYLHMWLCGVCTLQLLRLPIRIKFAQTIYQMLRRDDQGQEQAIPSLENLKTGESYTLLSWLNIAAVGWYVVGVVEVLRPSDCREKAPEVYMLSLILVVLFLAFVAFSLACRVIYVCILLYQNAQPRDLSLVVLSLPNTAAAVDAIASIPAFKFHTQNKVHPERDLTCSICLGDFVDQDTVARLPCGHLFHHDEIQTWLGQRGACPLCNDNVTLEKIQAVALEERVD